MLSHFGGIEKDSIPGSKVTSNSTVFGKNCKGCDTQHQKSMEYENALGKNIWWPNYLAQSTQNLSL